MGDPGSKLALAVYRWAKRRRRDELDKQMRRVRQTNLIAALDAVLEDLRTCEDPAYCLQVARVSAQLVDEATHQLTEHYLAWLDSDSHQ